ncbi:MAG: SUMF1/EgtB/PvdO family nonheme iron enzyme [Kiritimatiellia bacterium]
MKCNWIALSLLWVAFVFEVHATPLHQAVRARDLVTVREIIAVSIGSALDVGTADGVTPLHLAAATDQPDMIRLLIERGASVNSRTQHGFTPLHWAASRDAIESVATLLAAGADMDATARNDLTPLHWAASRDAARAVQMLLDAGANANARTASGDTPLHFAVRQGIYSQAAIVLAQFSLRTLDDDVLPELPTAVPERLGGEGQVVAVRPGMFLSVPIGLGEHASFVWLETLGIWFGKYEVTNGQYRRFRPGHSSRSLEGFSLDGDDQPVVFVSWEDALRYCEWLTEHFKNRIPEGYGFRLPTEAEWMYAASVGENRIYPWGDDWPPLYGNFSDESARQALSHWRGIEGYDDGYPVTAPVVNSGMNELGIFGLAGNVWEWTADWHDENQQVHKIRKGGSWDFDPRDSLRIAARGWDRPEARYETIGFRIVVAPVR